MIKRPNIQTRCLWLQIHALVLYVITEKYHYNCIVNIPKGYKVTSLFIWSIRTEKVNYHLMLNKDSEIGSLDWWVWYWLIFQYEMGQDRAHVEGIRVLGRCLEGTMMERKGIAGCFNTEYSEKKCFCSLWTCLIHFYKDPYLYYTSKCHR